MKTRARPKDLTNTRQALDSDPDSGVDDAVNLGCGVTKPAGPTGTPVRLSREVLARTESHYPVTGMRM